MQKPATLNYDDFAPSCYKLNTEASTGEKNVVKLFPQIKR